MYVTEHLASSHQPIFSFEILPPLKREGIQTIMTRLQPLIDLKPAFINVTYHREEYIYREHPTGLLERISTRKRPGTVGICAAIKHQFGIDTVPHIICGGFSKEDTENALIDLDFLGIDNVLLIRGDAIKSETHFVPEKDGYTYATELLEGVTQMNQGQYLHEETRGPKTNFCIGVAGYPEKHYESPNEEFDLRILKKKIDMGAHYVLTQMFFDAHTYLHFVKKCKEIGIDTPIIPGIKPITTKNQFTNIPRTFHASIPNELAIEIEKAKTNEEVTEIGIEWCISQSKALIQAGAPCIHYYTMSRPAVIERIIKACF